MAIAGRVAIVPKGDWSADATYKRLDAVTYNNALYFAKKDVPAGTATSNTEYWSKSIVGGVGAIATKEDAGNVKPADGLSIAEDGTLKVSIDGTTLTMDQVNNVIKLADALKEKIGSALQPESIVNNQVTTEAGFALDARQANPNIDGTLAKQVSDLNGSLKIKIVQWTPYCPRTDFADKVKLSEAMALRYGSLVICAIRIDLSENTPGKYVSIVNLPTKLFTGINQTNMDGKEGKWYLDKNTASVFLRSVFEAGTYWLNFMYLEAE
jgi:hypothetical protein